MDGWIRATKRQHCPVCDSDRWCGWTGNGEVVHCMNVSEGSYRADKSGGWMHRNPVDRKDWKPQPNYKTRRIKPINFQDLHEQHKHNCNNPEVLAIELGVSVESLLRLGIGWDGFCYTFPMFTPYGMVCGISRRLEGGKKCVDGSRVGLFWPKGIIATPRTRLFICEGCTDLAAMLDMGFDGIGRNGCSCSVDLIIEFLQQGRREVVIFSDKDKAKIRPDGSKWYPGQEGSAILAKAIIPYTVNVQIIAPPRHKDVRKWYQSGCTAGKIEALIKNTTILV